MKEFRRPTNQPTHQEVVVAELESNTVALALVERVARSWEEQSGSRLAQNTHTNLQTSLRTTGHVNILDRIEEQLKKE